MSALRHRFALRIALALLAVALLAFGLLRHGSKVLHAPPLPHVALQDGPLTLADLRGHAEAIVFYASWCTPCKQEAPAVERFARSSAGRGRLIAIDYDDYGNVRGFIRRYDWTFPVLSDPSGSVGDAYGLSVGLPTWIFLNPHGEIVFRASGPETVATLTRALAAAGT